MPEYIPNPSLRDADPVDVLRLIRTESIGPMGFYQLVKFCGSVERAIEQAPGMSARGGRKKPLNITSRAEAERELTAAKKYGAKWVVYGEAHYPRLLQWVPDAPPFLYALGHPHMLAETNMLAMVGARNASVNGCSFARKLASDLGQAGYVVVSGLARGIDTAAHKAALAKGTVAVIAGGIDTIYPPENEPLYHAIREAGVILSEAPFGSKPLAKSFPARNRIIAGMSLGTVVVEASLKSGSKITAHYAGDYGRDVFAVPGSPMDPRCQGTNQLIREGAVMVESAQDIVNNVRKPGELPLAEHQGNLFAEAPVVPVEENALEEARNQIVAALSPTPCLLEDLLAQTEISAHIALAVILELELAGRIARHPGARISLIVGDMHD